MARRGKKGVGLKVRVSHEPTRLSTAHVAAAFERLVPILERPTRQVCPEGDQHRTDATLPGTQPMRKR